MAFIYDLQKYMQEDKGEEICRIWIFDNINNYNNVFHKVAKQKSVKAIKLFYLSKKTKNKFNEN